MKFLQNLPHILGYSYGFWFVKIYSKFHSRQVFFTKLKLKSLDIGKKHTVGVAVRKE